jgi:16S rRNA (guanine1207-N2)-methyltransferase
MSCIVEDNASISQPASNRQSDMTNTPTDIVYGAPPAALAEVPSGAVQCSPQHPGAVDLADLEDASLASAVMLAPPGTLERRHALAQVLRTLRPGGTLTVLAPKDAGGSRLVGDLAHFGCAAGSTAKAHHRICVIQRPAELTGIDTAIYEGGLQELPDTDLWSQPGIFSWDRLDPGSALLLQNLPLLQGRGADFGCGNGMLAVAILASQEIKHLTLIDNDRRALAAAELNVADERAAYLWADIRASTALPTGLDFIVMNPPFHVGPDEDRSLGLTFIRKAAACLTKGGVLWLTANRHLPYEAEMLPQFAEMTQVVSSQGFKVYKATK